MPAGILREKPGYLSGRSDGTTPCSRTQTPAVPNGAQGTADFVAARSNATLLHFEIQPAAGDGVAGAACGREKDGDGRGTAREAARRATAGGGKRRAGATRTAESPSGGEKSPKSENSSTTTRRCMSKTPGRKRSAIRKGLPGPPAPPEIFRLRWISRHRKGFSLPNPPPARAHGSSNLAGKGITPPSGARGRFCRASAMGGLLYCPKRTTTGRTPHEPRTPHPHAHRRLDRLHPRMRRRCSCRCCPPLPSLLLATFLFAKSSPRCHAWIVSTKVYKTYVEAFKQAGGIPASTKVRILTVSFLVMGASALIVQKPVVWVILGCVALFLIYLMFVPHPHHLHRASASGAAGGGGVRGRHPFVHLGL